MILDARFRSTTGSLMLLAPWADRIPDTFHNVGVDREQHTELLGQVQRLRGSLYLEDGAIEASQLTTDGRHVQQADDLSWHVLSVQPGGQVTCCARYREHPSDVVPEELGVWTSALAQDAQWSTTLRVAIEHEIAEARRHTMSYVEVGGWAVARSCRGTVRAMDTALSTYALGWALGCIGITTATVRHCSSRILRKLGGRPLEVDGVALPSYFDPQYGCQMEILRFGSNSPSKRYGAHIDHLARQFRHLPVIAARPGLRSQEMAPERSGLAEMAMAMAMAGTRRSAVAVPA